MEALLKRELGTVLLKSAGHSAGGCISEGQSYDTDTGRVFVKINHKEEVLHLPDFNSLKILQTLKSKVQHILELEFLIH